MSCYGFRRLGLVHIPRCGRGLGRCWSAS